MSLSIEDYARVARPEAVERLRQLARPLTGARVVHVNSTREGGGVAEILAKLVPFMNELGMHASWEVLVGERAFYDCTKRFHNGLQGHVVELPPALLRAYEQTNRDNLDRLDTTLREADFVFIHDPQPAPLLRLCGERRGRWFWRCHIDVSRPHRPVWKYLRPHVADYDASIFSLADFAQPLPHPQFIVPPSIDPLTDKNRELQDEEIRAVRARFGIDPDRPLVAQISRFDRFKDPVGVIRAWRLARRFLPDVQLVLAGGGASDDPEGAQVLADVQEAAAAEADCHVLLLPADAHRTINALQRTAAVVLQKSLREGFGLTVAEAMWKGRPVIGGNTGGIRLQIVNHHTGFLVDTPEGAALRLRYLMDREDLRHEMGEKARRFVRDHFLITRHLAEYLAMMVALRRGMSSRVSLS